MRTEANRKPEDGGEVSQFFVNLVNWLVVLTAVCAILAVLVQAAAKFLFKWKPRFLLVLGALVAGNVFVVVGNPDFVLGVLGLGVILPFWAKGIICVLIAVCGAALILCLSSDFKGRRFPGFLKSLAAVAIGCLIPILLVFVGFGAWRSFVA